MSLRDEDDLAPPPSNSGFSLRAIFGGGSTVRSQTAPLEQKAAVPSIAALGWDTNAAPLPESAPVAPATPPSCVTTDVSSGGKGGGIMRGLGDGGVASRGTFTFAFQGKGAPRPHHLSNSLRTASDGSGPVDVIGVGEGAGAYVSAQRVTPCGAACRAKLQAMSKLADEADEKARQASQRLEEERDRADGAERHAATIGRTMQGRIDDAKLAKELAVSEKDVAVGKMSDLTKHAEEEQSRMRDELNKMKRDLEASLSQLAEAKTALKESQSNTMTSPTAVSVVAPADDLAEARAEGHAAGHAAGLSDGATKAMDQIALLRSEYKLSVERAKMTAARMAEQEKTLSIMSETCREAEDEVSRLSHRLAERPIGLPRMLGVPAAFGTQLHIGSGFATLPCSDPIHYGCAGLVGIGGVAGVGMPTDIKLSVPSVAPPPPSFHPSMANSTISWEHKSVDMWLIVHDPNKAQRLAEKELRLDAEACIEDVRNRSQRALERRVQLAKSIA